MKDWHMKVYLQRNILLGFFFSIIVVLGLAVTSYLYFNRMIEITRWAGHARRVLHHSEQVRALSGEIEIAEKGFALTGNEIFLEPHRSAVSAIHSHMKELDSLTADNPSQHTRIIKLSHMIDDRIKFSHDVINERKLNYQKGEALVPKFELNMSADSIKRGLTEFQKHENYLVTVRSLNVRRQFFQFVITFACLVFCMILILVVLTYMINSNLRSRTLTEERLKHAEHETAMVNKELESFTYSVSHDLRAPLRSINGYAEILREDYSDRLDEEGNRVINVISNNAKTMGKLIDDLLAFSRLSRQDLRRSKIDMADLVTSVLEDLLDAQNRDQILLNVRALEPSIGDINMIRQVWINLLSNAIKYSQKKELRRIEVGSYRQTQRENVYYVKDNGAGFDMQYKKKLFGVFQRLHRTEEFEGTGVGLALAKRIIDRHKGRIWAEAKVDEGATFYFSMPKV